MRFSFGEIDVADEVGIGYIIVFGDVMFGDKEDCISPFNTFRGVTGCTSTLFQTEKIVCSEDFSSRFLGAGSESVEGVFGACNGVNHRGSSGKYEAWLIEASVSSSVLVCR